jgi:DNA-binding NtrC family response regulator
VSHFVDKHGQTYGKPVHALGPGALTALLAHDWPGNVRELENAMERAVVLSREGEFTLEDLPSSLRGARARVPAASFVAPGTTLREMERDAILRTLALTSGSTVRAAKILGISARKVQYRLKEYRMTDQLPHQEPQAPPEDDTAAVA